MDFANLPPNVVANLLKDQSYEQILKICSSNKQAKANICDNDNFWRELYAIKYPNKKVNVKGTSWKQLFIVEYFKDKNLLSKVIWSIGDDDVFIRNDDEDEDYRIEDPEQIRSYLENYIIPWTTDENGDVWIDMDEEDQNEDIVYLKFKPSEYPTALAFMDLLIRYFQQDSGQNEELYTDQIKEVFFTEDRVRNKYEHDIETARLFRNRFMGQIDPPEVRERKIEEARIRDQELLENYLEPVREKGYISKGELRSVFSDHVYFEGIRLINPEKPGEYGLQFGS